MKLTSAQLDRAAGVLLGMACGDALGAGYEFGPPLLSGADVTMRGGGGFDWAPGEWTDDTSMAVPIIRAIADGKDLRDESVLDEIVAAWIDWARTAPDVGNQLRAVLSRTDRNLAEARDGGADPDPANPSANANPADPSERGNPAHADPARPARPSHAGAASAVRLVAQAHHDRHGRSGGNGSLMRTAPVALAFLDDPAGLAETARAISDLTHVDPDAGDACVLWCLAIRRAVLSGELNVRAGLEALPATRRALWESRLVAAEAGAPRDFDRNGWVVEALQGAWSAITEPLREVTDGEDAVPADHLRESLECAVRGGRDTDTVAAIAGGLLGARYGASAVPARWRRIVHGWPGLRADELVRLGVLAARATGRRPAVAGRAPFADRARRADVAILAGRASLEAATGGRADDGRAGPGGRARRDPATPDRRDPAHPDTRAPGALDRRDPTRPDRRDPLVPDRRDPLIPDRRAALADQTQGDSTAPDRRPRRDRANTTWPAADRLSYATSGDISTLVRHPHDPGVWLGAIGALDALPAEIDAVVSLCRVGRGQVPARIRPENRVAVWLVDEVDPRANPNLSFVLGDTVDAIAALRAEGRTVLVHCVQAISRTPTVGALYAARHRGVPIDQALREVTDALPHANPNAAFVEALIPRTMGGF